MKEGFELILNSVSIGYAKKALVENINLNLDQGKIVCVFGKNGSGKTTFIKSLLSLIPTLNGSVKIGNWPLNLLSQKEKAQLMSVVFSSRPSITNMSVLDYVMYGRYPYTNWLGINSQDDIDFTKSIIENCGIIHLLESDINELSDGEMQKVQISRAINQNAPILLLDEPVSHLDIANKAEIYNLLKNINRDQGKTIVFSSHDVQFALQLATDFIVIDEGSIEYMSKETFLSNKTYEKIMKSDFLDFDPTKNILKYKST